MHTCLYWLCQLAGPSLEVCQTAARQLPDSCQTAARQLGAIQIWSAECRAAFWRAISITHVAFLWTRFNSLWQERSVRDCLQYAATQPTHARGTIENRGKRPPHGSTKFGARSGRSRGDRCVRRLAASRQRVHSGAVTEGAAIKLALRLSGSQARRDAKATPAAHRAGTIDRRPKSRSDIAADEPAFKGEVAISRSRFRAV